LSAAWNSEVPLGSDHADNLEDVDVADDATHNIATVENLTDKFYLSTNMPPTAEFSTVKVKFRFKGNAVAYDPGMWVRLAVDPVGAIGGTKDISWEAGAFTNGQVTFDLGDTYTGAWWNAGNPRVLLTSRRNAKGSGKPPPDEYEE